MRSFLIGIKNVMLWSYERGSWQYDVLCLLIVAAVFLVPGSYFGDRDRNQAGTNPSDGSRLSRGNEAVIETEELQAFLKAGNRSVAPGEFPDQAIVMYLNERCRCEVALVKPTEVVNDAQGRTSYRVWYRVR